VYAAYFPWGVVSADGSHAYGELGGYRFAVNLWRVAVCDPSGTCVREGVNLVALYHQLRASGALSIDGGRPCYDVQLREARLAGHVFSLSGRVCFAGDGPPSRIYGVAEVDGRRFELSGAPSRWRGASSSRIIWRCTGGSGGLIQPCYCPRTSSSVTTSLLLSTSHILSSFALWTAEGSATSV